MITDPLQVRGISLLKSQAVETCLCGSSIPGVNEVLGNIDSNDFSPPNGLEEPP
jgi:hypothetical protein